LARLGGAGVEGCVGDAGRCAGLVAACADPRRRDPGVCEGLLGDAECLGLIGCLVDRDPFGMSAELNAMDWVLGARCPGVTEVALLASDTPEGRAAAEILKRYLVEHCEDAEVRVEEISGLGREFWQGLLETVKKVVDIVGGAYREGHMVYLNATGGFKPETAMALIAAMLAAPVAPYYKHEAMKQTVMLPPIPVQPDKGRIRLIVGQLQLLANENQVRLDDPRYAETQWILNYLAQTKTLQQLPNGYYKITPQAKQILENLAKIYEIALPLN
jgi:putative CRISPR-associated protein (TIGR02619 family)